jgi:membrane-bound metal-dependent hydrolase YbcI (DUF457 family)
MMGVQHKCVGVGFGIATALYATQGLGDPVGIWALATATVGCMLPDIDHDNSKIGRKRKVVTNLSSNALTGIVIGGIVVVAGIIALTAVGMINTGINGNMLLLGLGCLIAFVVMRKFIANSNTFKWMTHHRGLMHTIIPPIILFMLCCVSSYSVWRWTFIGLLVGYLSHLLADMLTVEGCPILWPLTRKNIRFLKLKTKDATTWIAAVGLAVLPIVIAYISVGGISQ